MAIISVTKFRSPLEWEKLCSTVSRFTTFFSSWGRAWP